MWLPELTVCGSVGIVLGCCYCDEDSEEDGWDIILRDDEEQGINEAQLSHTGIEVVMTRVNLEYSP